MPWWGWILLVIAVGLAFLESARRTWRRNIRREFRAYLEDQVEGARVVKEQSTSFLVRKDGREGVLNLRNLLLKLTEANAADFEARKPFYDTFIAMMRESYACSSLSLEVDRHRILPRLQPAAFFQPSPPEHQLARRALDGTGIFVVYVLDSPHSVRYLSEADRRLLGVDPSELHEIALANLRKNFSPDCVRNVLKKPNVVAVKMMDSFDAARLLLVPEHLEEGEAVAAAVPDRETLVLAPVPQDGNWERFARVSKSPASESLILDRPLRVTRTGFEIM